MDHLRTSHEDGWNCVYVYISIYYKYIPASSRPGSPDMFGERGCVGGLFILGRVVYKFGDPDSL